MTREPKRDRPEVTSEMIEAGVAALQTYRMEGDDFALAVAVYSAMVRVATHSPLDRDLESRSCT